jgi:hypothetical protein
MSTDNNKIFIVDFFVWTRVQENGEKQFSFHFVKFDTIEEKLNEFCVNSRKTGSSKFSL